MSKIITRADIMGELVDKFLLQEGVREEFTFGEFVVPVYDIGTHVKHWKTTETRIYVSANGSVLFLSVPENERWRVRRIDVLHETGANFDIDQVFLHETATQHQYIFYDTTTPITSGTVKIFELSQDIVMEKGELSNLYINVANYVAGGYVSIHVTKEVEIIR